MLFAGANTTYQTTKTGPVPGSNYNGNNATDEDVTVVNSPIANNTITAPATVSFCSGWRFCKYGWQYADRRNRS